MSKSSTKRPRYTAEEIDKLLVDIVRKDGKKVRVFPWTVSKETKRFNLDIAYK